MNNLNSLMIEGTAVKDIKVFEPVAGMSVGQFTIGISRWFKNREGIETMETSYIDCECYGVMAETFAKKIEKGRVCRVVGRLKQETWTDSENKAHSKVFVVAEHIELKPMKKDASKRR